MALDTSENWILNAVAASGREDESAMGFSLNPLKAVRGLGRAVTTTSRKIGNTLKGVPVVGLGLHSVYKVAGITIGGTVVPVSAIEFAAKVASGDRIDRAAYNGLKERVKAYQDVAPYAQTVVSFVPGVGQGLSGAIGAANALSKGQPITQAMIEAARGAVPGGPLATAAFDMAVAGVQGKPIDEVALNALPLPPEQKKYVVQSVLAAKDVALGKSINEAVYNRGRLLLPEQARAALDTGVAIAQGQKLQQIAAKAAPAIAPELGKIGSVAINKNPIFKAGYMSFLNKPNEAKGFNIGVGAAKFKSNPSAFTALRNSLEPQVKKGFDVAFATKIGMLAGGKPPIHSTPKEQFGYFAATGLKGAKPKNKIAIVNTLASNDEVKKGILKAAVKAKASNKKVSFLVKLKQWILGEV